jgi:hypothetical protein
MAIILARNARARLVPVRDVFLPSGESVAYIAPGVFAQRHFRIDS